MRNLIEYSWNYSYTIGSLCFFTKDKTTIFGANIADDVNFKSFKHKAKLLGYIAAQRNRNQTSGILENATIAMPLNCLSNFWRSLEMPLINGKVELKLK